MGHHSTRYDENKLLALLAHVRAWTFPKVLEPLPTSMEKHLIPNHLIVADTKQALMSLQRPSGLVSCRQMDAHGGKLWDCIGGCLSALR